MDDFVAFILTHGRPNSVITYRTLRKKGYTGPIVLIVDKDDPTLEEYKSKFKDEVFVFDKNDINERMDQGDNFPDKLSIVYARNASFEIARKLNYKYFIQLEDDYGDFNWTFDRNVEYVRRKKSIKKNLDKVFKAMLDYFKNTPTLTTIAMLQGGDLIGGYNGQLWHKVRRKVMNSMICDVDRPFQFFGRMNDDVNTYTLLGSQGKVMFSIPNVHLQQKPTQQSAGGLTKMYKTYGTYVKSFYSIMYFPSGVGLSMMGINHRRIHHEIKWNNTVPKILREEHKKK